MFKPVLAAALLSIATIASAQPLLFDNGPFVTEVGAGFGGADVSLTQSGTVISLGFNANAVQTPRVADDFTITGAGPGGQRLSKLHFYAVQSQSSNFTTNVQFGALHIALYNADPSTGVDAIAGDFTTNRLLSSTFSGVYRVSGTALTSQARPIIRLEADMSWAPTLQNGTYWMVLSAIGDAALAASPNPQAILVTPMRGTDNGRQFFDGSWFLLPIDFPFQLFGACPGDFNGVGGVTVQDIFDFLAAYFASDPSADVNGSGTVTVQDIFDFLSNYFAGCD